MSYSIYPNQFNFNDNGTYKGIDAIKGDSGDSAGFGTVTASIDNTSGTPTVTVTTSGPNIAKNINFAFSGIKGEGIGSGTFAPLVSFAAEKPTNAANHTMWVKDSSSFSLGAVMVGTNNTQPTQHPDGTTLQAGDLYVMGGKENNHPIVWGNVTFCPFRCWVYDGSAWVYKDAEVKVSDEWYPMNSEWIIENGVAVGQLIYPSLLSASLVNGELVFTYTQSGASNNYPLIGGGVNQNIADNPFTNVLEGALYNGNATSGGSFGAVSINYAGTVTSTNFNAYNSIARNSVVTNPIVYCHQSSSAFSTAAFQLSLTATSDGLVVARIKNWYKVFSDVEST